MAKDKSTILTGDRDLGTVTKKLSSGMFETSKGEKVPAFPGVAVGVKIKLEKHRFKLDEDEVKVKKEVSPSDAANKENAALKKRIEALEAQMGEKGSTVKAPVQKDQTAGADTTPPKAAQ